MAPEVPAVLTANSPEEAVVIDFIKYGFSALLHKPCRLNEPRIALEKVCLSDSHLKDMRMGLKDT
jgi:hypothetical protein